MIAVDGLLAGRRVLEAAPTSDQTNAFWTECKRALADPIAAGVLYKNESERILEWAPGMELEGITTGGRIRTKTAWDADTLRGDYADLLILDEYQIMKPNAWDEVGAPMLLDNNGDAVFIFTPLRRNHAHSLYQQAIADDTGRWGAWHFTSFDNPYLSKIALAEITRDMTESAYRQEILAEFLEQEGAVFRNIAACTNAPAHSTPAEHEGHSVVAGVDWAKQSDYTCVSVGCATCHQELAHDRFNKIDYAFQRDRIKALLERWHCRVVLVESNSIGMPNLEMLHRDGVNARGFETTGTTKPPLIENLALALERTEWQFQSDPVWTGELEAYEQRVNPTTGRSTYSAPDGVHDDTVIARALMVWLARRKGVLLA